MNPALNESSEIKHFECTEAIETRNGMMLFSTRDCHMCVCISHAVVFGEMICLNQRQPPTSAAFTLSFWHTSARAAESICVESMSPGRGKR